MKRRLALQSLGLVAVPAVLSACGGGSDSPAPPPPAPAPAPGPADAPAPTPVQPWQPIVTNEATRWTAASSVPVGEGQAAQLLIHDTGAGLWYGSNATRLYDASSASWSEEIAAPLMPASARPMALPSALAPFVVVGSSPEGQTDANGFSRHSAAWSYFDTFARRWTVARPIPGVPAGSNLLVSIAPLSDGAMLGWVDTATHQIGFARLDTRSLEWTAGPAPWPERTAEPLRAMDAGRLMTNGLGDVAYAYTMNAANFATGARFAVRRLDGQSQWGPAIEVPAATALEGGGLDDTTYAQPTMDWRGRVVLLGGLGQIRRRVLRLEGDRWAWLPPPPAPPQGSYGLLHVDRPGNIWLLGESFIARYDDATASWDGWDVPGGLRITLNGDPLPPEFSVDPSGNAVMVHARPKEPGQDRPVFEARHFDAFARAWGAAEPIWTQGGENATFLVNAVSNRRVALGAGGTGLALLYEGVFACGGGRFCATVSERMWSASIRRANR